MSSYLIKALPIVIFPSSSRKKISSSGLILRRSRTSGGRVTLFLLSSGRGFPSNLPIRV